MIKQYGMSMFFIALAITLLSSCAGNSLNREERCKMPSKLFDEDCNYRGTRSLH